MSKFQIILLVVFAVIALVAVLMFAGILPGFKKGGVGGAAAVSFSLWATFPADKISSSLSSFNEANKNSFQINYLQKSDSNYEKELINALAAGTGPDIFVLSQDIVLRNKDKIYPIPFASFPERNFKDSFIDSGEIFLDNQNQSVIAFPLVLDPIVLYWNRDLFSSAGISQQPQYWDEFLTDSRTLTKADEAGNIIQSGAALGEFRNIKDAKDILSMLVLQTGNPIIKTDTMELTFSQRGDAPLSPAESSVRFFDSFSSPTKSSYSWNKALSSSDSMFVSGSLAMYFGYASEIENIRQRNPHLNFDIAEVPQIRDGKVKATFGRVYGLAISKKTPNAAAAFTAIVNLTGSDFVKSFSEAAGLGATRRDVLAQKPADPNLAIVYKSAIMSRSWLEPQPEKVYEIFKNMIESTTAGKINISQAVDDANNKLGDLMK